ncbi:MAG: CDP-alcohol phosphatidyltransferase family protein [Candidatus Omnitrophica bacterium]|nr:CDP-alcohol phosphatidyltransferase family protein [Candidatus Omnitrophota bacterium]
MERWKNQIAGVLSRAGLSPNVSTCCGFSLAAAAGFFVYKGWFLWAGGLLLLSGFFDLMDGAIARLSNRVSPFGGILDSSLDRYGDGFVLGALLFYCLFQGNTVSAFLAISSLWGSFMISYVRARAECVIPECRVGFWERGERLVALALGFFVGNAGLVLWVLAVGTHWTALHRLLYAYHRLKAEEKPLGKAAVVWNLLSRPKDRTSLPYFWKAALLSLAIFFIRAPLP